jgi:O-acetyl-ADP-ribose deacetylase (regulator of RNase III)
MLFSRYSKKQGWAEVRLQGERVPTVFWTNPSVLALSRERDPVEAITAEARNVVFDALERGWTGPPFDPFALAELLNIETRPTGEVLDARTVPVGSNRYKIEFNPDRPRRRMRYSIFHEIAHTLFPDCAQMIRNRGAHNASRRDDWQLETLCNVAAAEFLLPTGALGQANNLQPSVDSILDLRRRYEASAEAALLRILRLSAEPAMAFSCHRDHTTGRYVIEYAAPTATVDWSLPSGSVLPARTGAAECTAIGYTAKKTEHWPRFGEVRTECVGIAPFPRDIYPRVIGFVLPMQTQAITQPQITYVRGDATQTRGEDRKVLVQVVNDGAFTWGGSGFAAAVKRRWPSAQKSFTDQVRSDRSSLRLGSVVTCHVEPDVTLASLVAQRGYGHSPRPRIRYGALKDCLLRVSEIAKRLNASVHMPRIGAGQAGGAWPVVAEIVNETLTRVGIKVLVYDLPQGRERPKPQADLAFTA